MNSCILLVEIIQEPQLRFTTDQLEVTDMLVQFQGTREGEPPSTLKVVAWRNLAKEIQQNYHAGDRVIVEGRLGMNTIEHPAGYKEKRAELTVQRIYGLGDAKVTSIASVEERSPVASNTRNTANREPAPSYSTPAPPPPAQNNYQSYSSLDQEEAAPANRNNKNKSYNDPVPDQSEDDIPF